ALLRRQGRLLRRFVLRDGRNAEHWILDDGFRLERMGKRHAQDDVNKLDHSFARATAAKSRVQRVDVPRRQLVEPLVPNPRGDMLSHDTLIKRERRLTKVV